MPSGGKRLDAVLLETNSKCSKRFFLPQGHSHCKGTWNIRAKKQCVSMENQGTGGQRVLLFFSVKKGTVCSSQPSNLQWAVDSCLPVHVDEGFDRRDDGSQDQLTSWSDSGESFLHFGIAREAAQQAAVAGEALRLTGRAGRSLGEQDQETGT